MKELVTFLFVLIISSCASRQVKTYDFGTYFSKSNKKSIDNKMTNFIARVSEETSSPKEKITFKIDDYYTDFYSESCRHLPKKVTFKVCVEERTYKHNGLSGAVLYWVLGSWTLSK